MKRSVEHQNSTNRPPPHFEAHKHYISGIDNISCHHIIFLIESNDDFCDFVRVSHSCYETYSLINYADLVFCRGKHFFVVKEIVWIFVVLTLMLLAVILITIIYTRYITNFLCIVRHIRMSQYNTGAVILAFTDALPSIIAHSYNIRYSSSSFEPLLVVNQVFGTAMYLTMLQTGLLIAFIPFDIESRYLRRDFTFMTVNLIIFVGLIQFDFDPKIIGGIFVLMYVIYVVYVLVEKYFAHNVGNAGTDILEEKGCERSFSNEKSRGNQKTLKLNGTESKSSGASLFGQYRDYINPYKDAFVNADPHWIWWRLMFPFRPIIGLFVPVMETERSLEGWCKLGDMITLLTTPALTFIVWNKYVCYVLLSFTLCILIITTVRTKVSEVPSYHLFFAVYGVSSSIFLIYLISCEIIGIVILFGNISGFSRTINGVTLVSYTVSLASVVTRVLIIRRGFKVISFAANISTAMLHVFLILGLIIIAEQSSQNGRSITTKIFSYSISNIVFLLISVVMAFAGFSLVDYRQRKSVGIFMILLYLFYFVFAILVECEVIHSYGTKHSMYDDEEDNKSHWA